jgi:murein DD-endopeptidase MepM/ murein hydrolase activator NlpD
MKHTLLWLSVSLIGLVISQHSLAKKYYKHVDENGITHYSDQPPAETDDFESWQVRPEDTQFEVTVVNRGTQQSPVYYAVNPYHGPVEVVLSFISRNNVKADPPWPRSYVVPANSDTYLATIKAINPERSWSFQYNIASTLGDPNAVHDQAHAYQLPFPGNQHHFISQGFNGVFSHQDEQNRYALDITLPEGTPVLAARTGVVMDIAEDFYDGGTDSKNMQRGNYIRILHDDGSMAIYAHLQLESVEVARGQRVLAQQPIAKSGNTGFTSGPHLHFAVQVNQGLKLVSVPFQLRHKSGEVKAPVVGPI